MLKITESFKTTNSSDLNSSEINCYVQAWDILPRLRRHSRNHYH